MVISGLITAALLVLARLFIREDQTKNKILKFFAIITVVIHYSNLWVDYFASGGSATIENNQILPVYPCNVVMWMLLIAALMQRRLMRAAIALAAASVMLSLVMYQLEMFWAAVFELSVCAGLITVVLISASSLTSRDEQDAAAAEPSTMVATSWASLRPLPPMMVSSCISS